MDSEPIPLLTERSAATQAIAELERGRRDAAIEVLRQVMRLHRPPTTGPDARSDDIMRLRAHIEKAIVELQHDYVTDALHTLRLGVAVDAAGDQS